MIDALAPHIELDAIFGVPYSSNRTDIIERWTRLYGDRVCITQNMGEMEAALVKQLARSLTQCRQNGQRLIIQEVGGFVVPILHKYFRDQLHLVKGVVELTKQGVWRDQEIELQIPVLHCAGSELKRLEAKRCGETIARCLDGVARELGISLAGRYATVFGAGWIGSGVARALRRLDMIPSVVEVDPLKIAEARLDGFHASRHGDHLERSALVVGATGRQSITPEVLARIPDGALVASASSRQHEIDVAWLQAQPRSRINDVLDAYHLVDERARTARNLLLVNNGFPANFIPGSGSVPDEIVETILAELIALMHTLSRGEHDPGIHPIGRDLECFCAEIWLELRDRTSPQHIDDAELPPLAAEL
ncbi:hypothetical protein [Paralimibaculum aggregatum]|nr:hypothetical protein [Limibaculum sp. NKW23]